MPKTEKEFRDLVEPLLARAAGYARTIVRSREDAEDAVQDAMWKAWRGFEQFDQPRSFKAWFFAIVRNSCLDLLRRRGSRPSAVSLDEGAEPVSGATASSGLEERDAIRWAIAQLSPALRQVIELRYFADCSYVEIAEVLGIPEGTVTSRLHAARLAMLETYQSEGGMTRSPRPRERMNHEAC